MGWLSGYQFRRPLTVSNSYVDSLLTDFPLCVALSSCVGLTRSDGYDIRFTSSDGSTLLSFEREYYSFATNAGTGIFWVKSSILSSAATTLYYYYGKSTGTDGSGIAAWDANYGLVYHFGNSTLSVADATSNGRNATNTNGVYAAGGKTGGCVDFTPASSKFVLPSFAVPTTGTLSLYWNPKQDPATTETPLFDVRTTGAPLRIFGIDAFSDGKMYAGWYNNGNDKRVAWTIAGISQGTWYRVDLTWTNGGTTELFIDGVSKGSTPTLNATFDTSTGCGGNLNTYYGATAFGKSYTDELRLSSIARAAAWLKFERYNAAGGQVTIGDEEVYREHSHVFLG